MTWQWETEKKRVTQNGTKEINGSKKKERKIKQKNRGGAAMVRFRSASCNFTEDEHDSEIFDCTRL